MAIEILKSTVPGSIYTDYPSEVWQMGVFFSGGTHFKIIDSWSTHYQTNKGAPGGTEIFSSKRYKGDPIADDDPSQPGYKVWRGTVDMGTVNDWIIIECQTTLYPALGLPKWQVKLQWTGGSPFADVSDYTGVKYPKNHGGSVGREFLWRFSPWGGWDLADVAPDFNPSGVTSPNPTTENNGDYMGHHGSGIDTRFYVVAGDGWLLRFHRKNQNNPSFCCLGGIYGDVVPVDLSQMSMPRAQMGFPGNNGYVFGNAATTCALCNVATASSITIYADYTKTEFPGITFWDNNGKRWAEGYTVPGYYNLTAFSPANESGLCQSNIYGSMPEIELFPFLVSPSHRNIGPKFSIPGLRQGFGVGQTLVANKTWLSTALTRHCPYIAWDGSTNPWD